MSLTKNYITESGQHISLRECDHFYLSHYKGSNGKWYRKDNGKNDLYHPMDGRDDIVEEFPPDDGSYEEFIIKITNKADLDKYKNFKKFDTDKPKLSILRDFPRARIAVSRVLSQGAEKYGRTNWKNVNNVDRYEDALDRHLDLWHNGERFDSESNESHLAHCISNLLFILELEQEAHSENG